MRGSHSIYMVRLPKFNAVRVTDSLSTMLQLLGEESEAASWLIEARSRMEPVEPCDEEW